MQLIIVESPSKAKTIEKYLGGKYKVDASGGHVRDLPEKRLGVNIAKNYEPNYVISADKKPVIKRLKEKVEKADKIYLATDPDREGEAISWHLQEVLCRAAAVLVMRSFVWLSGRCLCLFIRPQYWKRLLLFSW